MPDHSPLSYCPSLFARHRRPSREVMVGNVGVGGDNPIRVQSMITSDTRDTEACVKEVLGLAAAGCEVVRITAQTVKYAENLEHIRDGVRNAGCEVPLVADIHFKPDAALEAAKWVEKVRVNPGNYADKKKFEVREYTDAEYEAELARIREKFEPLVVLCKDLGRAMRIGTNHGSLSDRIMNRFGDTPLGMVESALEFVRIARDLDYHDIIFSMKASNPKVMIEAYRLLVARLYEEGPDWNYPIHLGVTEAGDGEDGRIKSAIGIGSLLNDGIGDTIRVSLTEDAIHEIPVAEALARPFQGEPSGCGGPPQSVPAAARGGEAMLRRASFLPHLEKDGGVYAITYRLDDAVPPGIVEKYRSEKERIERRIEIILEEKGSSSRVEELKNLRNELAQAYERIIEVELQKLHGSCALREPGVPEILVENWNHFAGKDYDLLAWCIMPNHVHLIIRAYPGKSLPDILQSWKSYTAKKINKLVGQDGKLWQKEYYDHLIRDEDDLVNQVKYLLRNPASAGLDGWPWTDSAWGTEPDAAAASCRRDGLPRAAAATHADPTPTWDPFSYERRAAEVMEINGHELGGDREVRVFTTRKKWDALAHKLDQLGDFQPEIVIEDSGVVALDPRDEAAVAAVNDSAEARLVTVADGLDLPVVAAFRLLAARLQPRHPILLKDSLTASSDAQADFLESLLRAARNIGSLLCDGIGDAIIVQGEEAPGQSLRLSYNILQAAGARIFKTDYVACPSCGRTLFNLQTTTQKIREATGHLKGVRIAVMGCIVNGPGEMADADFGYVGGAPSKINLYVGKTAVKFNIPEDEAVERLIDLIREHGKWIDPPVRDKVEA